MHRDRLLLLACLCATVGLSTVASPRVADAARASQVKFWASEFVVTQEVPKAGDALQIPTFTLQVIGRASAYGGEKVEFDFTVPDARPWLDLLQVCSGSSGRLSGTISPDAKLEEGERNMVGSGALIELNCRHVLK